MTVMAHKSQFTSALTYVSETFIKTRLSTLAVTEIRELKERSDSDNQPLVFK